MRVGIIFGGRSGEHEVSVTSASSIFKHIDRNKYEPIAIRIEKDGSWSFPQQEPAASNVADAIAQASAAIGVGEAEQQNAPDPLLSLSEEIASWDHLWRTVG